MNWYRLLNSGLLVALVIVSGCGRKRLDDPQQFLPVGAQYHDEPSRQQPITVVMKTPPMGSVEQAPLPTAPLPEPTVLPVVGGAPSEFVVPPPEPGPPVPVPVPVPVPIDFCGDGIKQKGEDCDDGDDDNGDSCDNFCRKPRCGNGVIEGDEECDNPEHPGCTDTCTLPLCGNGIVDANEECDPPNDTTCNADCQESECGNGDVEVGEECDDGNDEEGDGCSNECELSCIEPGLNARRRP